MMFQSTGGYVRIALDAMGGDHAPKEPVAGAVQAARELGIPVTLVGPQDAIAAELARQSTSDLPIEIVHAPDVVDMAEHPAQAVRRLPHASMNVAMRLVKDGQAAAFVSAGNTGAAMVAALFGLGRIPGIERPALATLFPTATGHCLVLDIGANVDCRPEHLHQFALMGDRYARVALDLTEPRIGLLSNGEEETKGNKVVIEAHQLLKTAAIRFVGNIEGKDLTRGRADVVVCDGFTGNVLIKGGEGFGELTFDLLREAIAGHPLSMLGALLLRPALRRLKRRIDYQEYGGAPLLGVNGVAIVAHGRSRARAIRNAIRVAHRAAQAELPKVLAATLADREAAPETSPTGD